MKQKWYQEKKRVHYKDTDQMGVVHHANYVTWFEIGRTEAMRQAGLAYSKVEDLGLLLPVLDVQVSYHKPAHYDDQVVIFTSIKEFSPVRLGFAYEVRKVSDEELNLETDEPYGELLTSGATMHMWVNAKWRPARIDKKAPEIYALLQDLTAKC